MLPGQPKLGNVATSRRHLGLRLRANVAWDRLLTPLSTSRKQSMRRVPRRLAPAGSKLLNERDHDLLFHELTDAQQSDWADLIMKGGSSFATK